MSKTLNVKVPKRIAGVKIPKGVRKGPILDFLNSSGGQVLVAEALLLAARSYASKHVDPASPVGEVLNHPIRKAKDVALSGKTKAKHIGNGASAASAQLTHAFEEAMRAFRVALNTPIGAERDDAVDDDVATARGEAPEPESQKKRTRRASAQPIPAP